MKREKRLAVKRARRVQRVRSRIHGSAARPRLAVYRSLKHMYAQLIDDDEGKTLVASSDLELTKATEPRPSKPLSRKAGIAYAVGKLLADKAKAKKIVRVVFDRRGFRYHGRVAALAQGAREGGLTF